MPKFQPGFYFSGGHVKVTWQWFRCEVNKKCIHSQSRCDLHPHPACVYNNTETGKMVAEDEEGCLNPDYKYSYKAKGLIEPSANLIMMGY